MYICAAFVYLFIIWEWRQLINWIKNRNFEKVFLCVHTQHAMFFSFFLHYFIYVDKLLCSVLLTTVYRFPGHFFILLINSICKTEKCCEIRPTLYWQVAGSYSLTRVHNFFFLKRTEGKHLFSYIVIHMVCISSLLFLKNIL